MKPLLLKISGVNSFYDEQIIDFTKIINKGIFGIFGPTGSGKSSIIDSITLALYGKINRYDGQKGNREFININSKTAKVIFKFSIKNGKKLNNYLVERHFKKDDKGSIKATICRLSILNFESQEIIADKILDVSAKLEKIIGLNYEDFIRAVVLPQGKFSEFLMLENKDKRNMLERIFNLEKYGLKLSEKINERKRAQEQITEGIIKDLEFLGDISCKYLEEKKKFLKNQEDNLINLQKSYISNFENLNNINQNIKLKNDLNYFSLKLKEIEPYKTTVEEWEYSLINAKKADLIKPYLEDLENLKIQIQELKDKKLFKYNKLKETLEDYKTAYNYYEIAKKNKDENYINLQNHKIKIENSIKVYNELKEIENNIFDLNDELNKLKKIFDKANIDLKELENKKHKFFQETKKIKDYIKSNKIERHIKEKIQYGNTLEEKLTILKQELNDNKFKLDTLNNDNSECLENIKKLEDSKIYFEQNIQKYQNDLEVLENDNVTKEYIQELKYKIIILKNELSLLEEKNIEKDTLITQKQQLEKNLKLYKQEISSLQKELDIYQNSLQHIKEQIFTNSLIKKVMSEKICPICKNTENLHNLKPIHKDDFLKIQKEQKNLEEKIKNLKSKISLLERQNVELEVSLKNIEQTNLNINKYFEKNTIDSQKNEINKYENILDESIKKFEQNSIKKEQVIENLTKFKEKLTNINLELSSKNQEIKNINQNIKEYELKLKNILNEKNNINDKLEDLQNLTQIINFKEKYEQIKLTEKEIEKLENQELKIIDNANDVEKEINNTQNILKQLEQEIIKLEAQIQEKNKYKDNLYNKIKEFDNINLNEYLEEIKNNLDSIQNEEINKKNTLDLLINKKNKEESEYQIILTKLETLQKNKQEKEFKISKKIEENSLENIEKVKSMILTKERQNYLEQKIISFKEKLTEYTLNKQRLEKELETIDINNLEILKQDLTIKLEELKNLENKTQEEVGKLKIEIEIKEKDYIKKLELEKELELENKKLDLITELANLNKGGVFVEYVAISQLKQIVIDAGKKLMDMSGGKFSIELKNSDFIIKDYHNGGITRSPKSLSGGEVFMASLSLALSLSTKIQLNNRSPLEIFFLDEGFGTLDNNLLDTVISSLEKLQSQNIDVGIITHLDEIKNRISSKVLVDFNSSSIGAKIYIE